MDRGDTPTVGQVEDLIDTARELIGGTVGPPGERCLNGFEQAVALQAAMLVEISYFPEQVRSERSPYMQLEAIFARVLDAYRACIASEYDPDWRPARVYTVRTPSVPDRRIGMLIANWNDPYADEGEPGW